VPENNKLLWFEIPVHPRGSFKIAKGKEMCPQTNQRWLMEHEKCTASFSLASKSGLFMYETFGRKSMKQT
jgi:hypothetical protein